MTRKLLFILMILLGGNSFLQAARIPLVGIDDHTSTIPGGNKSPIRPWYIDQDGNELTMSATPCDYTLNLYDEDDEVVYSVFVPAGSTMIVLPSTLSGSFEIRFETDTYYYYGYIDL